MQPSMSMGVHMKQELSLTLAVTFGESSGDIPIYSLHRISRLLLQKPVRISADLNAILKRCLVAANATYREQSGNKRWSCLTSSNLVEAIENVDLEIRKITESIQSMPQEDTAVATALKKVLDTQRQQSIKLIQSWFADNHDEILYNMDGKIPWPVVCRLRKNLSLWIAGVANPFDEPIGTMILDVAREAGITIGDSDDTWKAMGGQLLKKRKK